MLRCGQCPATCSLRHIPNTSSGDWLITSLIQAKLFLESMALSTLTLSDRCFSLQNAPWLWSSISFSLALSLLLPLCLSLSLSSPETTDHRRCLVFLSFCLHPILPVFPLASFFSCCLLLVSSLCSLCSTRSLAKGQKFSISLRLVSFSGRSVRGLPPAPTRSFCDIVFFPFMCWLRMRLPLFCVRWSVRRLSPKRWWCPTMLQEDGAPEEVHTVSCNLHSLKITLIAVLCYSLSLSLTLSNLFHVSL